MARVKKGVTARKRHKKIIKLAKDTEVHKENYLGQLTKQS